MMRTPGVRTITEFAEQEITLAAGPRKGEPFTFDLHPAGRLLYRELESGAWERAFVTACNQDGKSLVAFVIPILYTLFEREETALVGVPSDDIVRDKWTVDLLPTIKASARLAAQLPSAGLGSRGGTPSTIEFRNGAVLRFMTAGGDDQSRASFATPNLYVSETEGFDEVGSSSREGDKFSQLERRLLAFGSEARLLAECTVGVAEGRTWKEYTGGTESRIALPCPHCGDWVTPEREHFVGWQGAESDLEACELAHLACPGCGAAWTNDERIDANRRAVLVHKGQQVDADGTVVGNAPRTKTLGFRWTVVNSILNPERLPAVGGEEWRALRAADEDAADTDLCQKQWTKPAKSTAVDLTQLDHQVVAKRTTTDPRGRVPSNCDRLVVTIDVGKWLCHWVAIAFEADGTPHVVEYGRLQVPTNEMGEERALLAALREFRDGVVAKGWESDLGDLHPGVCLADSGWRPDVVYAFCLESGEPWLPSKGFGTTRDYERPYRGVKQTGALVAFVGEQYHLARLPKKKVRLVEFNADHWKGWTHDAWHTPVGRPGAMVLHAPDPEERTPHGDFSRHQCAEKRYEEFVPGHGTVKRWRVQTKHNHWLDAVGMAGVAHHYGEHRPDSRRRAPRTPRRAKARPAGLPPGGQPDAPGSADEAPPEADAGSSWWANRRRRR